MACYKETKRIYIVPLFLKIILKESNGTYYSPTFHPSHWSLSRQVTHLGSSARTSDKNFLHPILSETLFVHVPTKPRFLSSRSLVYTQRRLSLPTGLITDEWTHIWAIQTILSIQSVAVSIHVPYHRVLYLSTRLRLSPTTGLFPHKWHIWTLKQEPMTTILSILSYLRPFPSMFLLNPDPYHRILHCLPTDVLAYPLVCFQISETYGPFSLNLVLHFRLNCGSRRLSLNYTRTCMQIAFISKQSHHQETHPLHIDYIYYFLLSILSQSISVSTIRPPTHSVTSS